VTHSRTNAAPFVSQFAVAALLRRHRDIGDTSYPLMTLPGSGLSARITTFDIFLHRRASRRTVSRLSADLPLCAGQAWPSKARRLIWLAEMSDNGRLASLFANKNTGASVFVLYLDRPLGPALTDRAFLVSRTPSARLLFYRHTSSIR